MAFIVLLVCCSCCCCGIYCSSVVVLLVVAFIVVDVVIVFLVPWTRGLTAPHIPTSSHAQGTHIPMLALCGLTVSFYSLLLLNHLNHGY